MEINRVSSTRPIKREQPSIANKKGFSQSFSFAREKKSEQELREMLDDIKKRGNKLAITKCYADVRAYRDMIKEYLESILKHMYDVKKDVSFWQTQYFITVETIDQKLEELTQGFLTEQAEHLDIASTIDEITGLVVDIYK